MLTGKTQYSLKNAKGYFQEHLAVGDYYQEGQQVAGQWFGEDAGALGLSGRVGEEEFLALCDNVNPQTGERLTLRLNRSRSEEGRAKANRRIFYDFTFSPPKSVSLVALLTPDARVVESHHRAVDVALRELERFSATRIRKKGARDLRLTGNVVAARFTHDTSRALDPHLHTHVIVFNATFDGSEERWKALENYEMLRARKFVETLYYHELTRDLRRFGYAIRNRPQGDFQIEGMPEELCERFSKRHEQINEALDELLASKPELNGANLKDLRERLAAAERSRKVRNLAPSELRRLWAAQLTMADQAVLANLTRRGVGESKSETTKVVQEAIGWAEEHLFDRRSVVTEAEIWQCALEHARGQAIDWETLRQATGARGYLRDPKTPCQVTTAPVLQREWEIVATAANGAREFDPFIGPEFAPNPALDSEQSAALGRLVRSRDFISLFRGGAGTGKSFVLLEFAAALAKAGWPLAVLAPQRQQVLDLQAAGFPVPTTVADFLGRRDVRKGTVVIVDEAGQIGARQMLALIRLVGSFAGRLVLSGDTRQHGPVEASDALLAIERYSGLKPVELEQIRRQNPDLAANRTDRAAITAYRSAVESAAAGRLAESFDRLDRMGAVTGCRFDEQAETLATEYLRLLQEGHSIVVVSQTWSEVHRVNAQVREGLKAIGRLGNEEASVEALERIDLTPAQKRDARFHEPGNVIVFNRQVRQAALGATGRFVSVLSDAVLVEVGKQVVKVPIRHLDRITVCRRVELPISAGDRLQLKANRRQRDGSSVVNGELVTVRALRSNAAIELEDGRVLEAGYREFVPGYAVTSYGAQGKTVDYVLFSDSAVKVATNDQQWYVTISRGRKGIRIYTPDKEQLRENVIRSGQRRLALEITGPLGSTRGHRIGRREVLTQWYKRFGGQAAEWMIAARRARRFNRNRQLKHVHQIKHRATRMLVG